MFYRKNGELAVKKNRDKISLWKRKRFWAPLDIRDYIAQQFSTPPSTPLMDMLQKEADISRKSDSTLRIVSRQLGYDVD